VKKGAGASTYIQLFREKEKRRGRKTVANVQGYLSIESGSFRDRLSLDSPLGIWDVDSSFTVSHTPRLSLRHLPLRRTISIRCDEVGIV
jgi:hypothetical protein